jgi:hypothetical protein
MQTTRTRQAIFLRDLTITLYLLQFYFSLYCFTVHYNLYLGSFLRQKSLLNLQHITYYKD